jgi:hypothetical protein
MITLTNYELTRVFGVVVSDSETTVVVHLKNCVCCYGRTRKNIFGKKRISVFVVSMLSSKNKL